MGNYRKFCDSYTIFYNAAIAKIATTASTYEMERKMSDDRPILVSEAEIAKRRHSNALTAGSFAVDNITTNPELC